MSQNWEFGNLSKNVGVEIHKILARLTNAEKDLQPKATAGLVQLHSVFCKRFLLKKKSTNDAEIQKKLQIQFTSLGTLRFGRKMMRS